MIAGHYLGEILRDDNPLDDTDWLAPPGAGSCITVIATDAPLLPGQCKALARQGAAGPRQDWHDGKPLLRRPVPGVLGRARERGDAGQPARVPSGADGAADELARLEFVQWGQMDPLYEAVVQCVEEAVLNVLVASTTMIGRDGHRSPGFPVERLPELLAR